MPLPVRWFNPGEEDLLHERKRHNPLLHNNPRGAKKGYDVDRTCSEIELIDRAQAPVGHWGRIRKEGEQSSVVVGVHPFRHRDDYVNINLRFFEGQNLRARRQPRHIRPRVSNPVSHHVLSSSLQASFEQDTLAPFMATTTRLAISNLPLKTKLPSLTYRTRIPMSSSSSSSSYRKPVMFKVPGTDRNEQELVRDKTFERYTSRSLKRNGEGTAIVWFRNDLRVIDNEALYKAWISSEVVLPVYCVDPRLFHTTHSFGFPKTGALRARFLMESVDDLRNNLMKKGLNLVVRHGKPEDVLPSLADAFAAHTVFAHKETCSEEVEVEGLVRKALGRLQVPGRQNPKLQLVWGSTLYHIDDLPFDPRNLPDVYTQFRKSVETKCAVRGCCKLPMSLGPLPDVKDWGIFPSMDQLGLCPLEVANGMRFVGGETAALGRLNDYFWNKDLLKFYKETRNGMLGPDYSTKFSPWLASGSISPRFIYEEVKRYEVERVANDSTYWVLFELIWRDYFRFISIKYGNSIFHTGGPRNVEVKWTQDQRLFESWRDGNTGYPLIDANMKELSATGFMSNRGRQIVCSFLVRDMGIDWRMGAEWFETCLLDYDPCSNYGNWTYGAGVGNDPREDRYFSIPKQAQTYDPEGEYVAYWLPQLRKLPKEKRNSPGASYTDPIVPLKHGSLGRQQGKQRIPAFRQNRTGQSRRS